MSAKPRSKVLTIAVTDKDEALIGYSVNFILPHPKYDNVVTAVNDRLFINKDYRKSSLSLQLIKATEQHAKQMGAKLIAWAAKPNSTLAKLVTSLGYGVEETIYTKGF